MISIKRMGVSYLQFVRYASVLKRATAELDDEVFKSIESKTIKPKRHPGKFSRGPFPLPDAVKLAINKLSNEDIISKQVMTESVKFQRYLLSRTLPLQENQLLEIKSAIREEVEASMGVNIEDLTEEELKKYTMARNNEITKLLKQRVYNWKMVDYTKYIGLLYLVSRSAAEYAALSRIFSEIAVRCPSFKPKTLFDFGSGVGSVVWAAHALWGKSISEYYCVDSSADMNDLNETIIESYDNEKLKKSLFYRQFLPASNEITSDVVVSAYSLLELPSSEARLEVIKNLWGRTSKFLVLIEHGHLAGFKMIQEARDFIISKERKKTRVLFSPCPHDLPCPRVPTKTMCYFEATFPCFPQKPEHLRREEYTYAVFQKGSDSTKEEQWPRIVQPVLCKSRHVICRLCTNSGNLCEVTVSPSKHGREMYKCAEKSVWGDLLPGTVKEIDPKDKNNPEKNEPITEID